MTNLLDPFEVIGACQGKRIAGYKVFPARACISVTVDHGLFASYVLENSSVLHLMFSKIYIEQHDFLSYSFPKLYQFAAS